MLSGHRHLPWPRNLWSVIFQKNILETEMPKDWEEAVEHVFKTNLDDKKAEILYDYFREGMTLQKAGNKYGITLDAVRRRVCKAIKILQEPTPKIILGHGLKEGTKMLAELRADGELVNKEKISEITQAQIRERLIADIGAIRAENAKTRLWDSDERIADYLLSKGWTLPTRCGSGREHVKAKGLANSGAETNPSLILSQKARLEGLGRNVLVLGTAGTGKTRYYVLPNLLQCRGSCVVIDTAGSLYRDTARVFEEKGYEIKTFDVKEVDADIEKFDVAAIGRKPTVLYIILGFNNEANSNLVRPLVQKIMTVCSFATEVPVHLFLDEFGCIAEIPDFHELLNGTNPNLSCSIILQSIAQLQEKYKETWKEIVQRCDTTLYFGGGHDWRTCEYLSGFVSQQKSGGFGKMAPDEIRKMQFTTCLILAPDRAPIIDKVYDPEKHPNHTPY